jgi:hypothetical protein
VIKYFNAIKVLAMSSMQKVFRGIEFAVRPALAAATAAKIIMILIIIESTYYQVIQIEIDKRLILYQIQSMCKIQVLELVRKQWQIY